MNTQRDTGAAALAALALRYCSTPPQQAVRVLLALHAGNVTKAATDLGVGRKSLLAAVTALGQAGWLDESWPNRAKGGQGARQGRKVRS